VVFQGIYNTGYLEFQKKLPDFSLIIEIYTQSLRKGDMNINAGRWSDRPDLAFRRVAGLWHD
jgi:hypothetical protein